MIAANEVNLVEIAGVSLEVVARGSGAPLLFLAGEDALEANCDFVSELARTYRVYLPSPPGFGRSSRPDWIARPDDIAYLYLELVTQLGIGPLPVVGASLGGWIAAEMATKGDPAVERLVLIDPYGIKTGGPTAGEIADLWFLSKDDVAARKWVDAQRGKLDITVMDDEQLMTVVRNGESFARFCWEPYMHDPQLSHRLGRIRIPTLLIWGERDGIVNLDYARAYRALIPSATLMTIPNAAHYPHLEQPTAVLEQLEGFLA